MNKISKQLHWWYVVMSLPEPIPHSESVKWRRMASFCWILGSGKLPMSVCINAYRCIPKEMTSFWSWIGKTTLQDNMLQAPGALEFVFSIEVPLALPLPDSAAASVARLDMPTKGLTTSEHSILGAALGNRTDGLYSFSLANSIGNWCIACHPQHLGKSRQKGHNKPLAIACTFGQTRSVRTLHGKSRTKNIQIRWHRWQVLRVNARWLRMHGIKFEDLTPNTSLHPDSHATQTATGSKLLVPRSAPLTAEIGALWGPVSLEAFQDVQK